MVNDGSWVPGFQHYFDEDSLSLYSKVLRRVFNDERFRKLSQPPPNGADLFIRLLCGPELTCVPGLVPIGEAALAEAMGWPIAGFRKAFSELEREKLVRADWSARLVWVPKAIKHNPPANPNVVVGWYQVLDLAPECPLKTEALDSLRAFVVAKGGNWPMAWDMAVGKVPRKRFSKRSTNRTSDDPDDDSDNDYPDDHLECHPNQESGSLRSGDKTQDRSAGDVRPSGPGPVGRRSEALRTGYLARFERAYPSLKPDACCQPMSGGPWLELARETTDAQVGPLLDAFFADEEPFVAKDRSPSKIRSQRVRLLGQGPTIAGKPTAPAQAPVATHPLEAAWHEAKKRAHDALMADAPAEVLRTLERAEEAALAAWRAVRAA